MSSVCIFNLKKSDLTYSELNSMLKTLINSALTEDMAIFYGYQCYADDLIKSANMEKYFFVSDSFVYPNADFVEPGNYSELTSLNYSSFSKKFDFLNRFIEVIFRFSIQRIEIYMTSDGSVNSALDFEEVECTRNNFMEILFQSVLSHSLEYDYGFPTVKYIVQKE